MAALAFAATSAAAADDPLLARLAGEWIGNGLVKLGPTAAAERIYCRIVATLVDGNAIEQKGRCSIASNSRALAGTIVAKGDGRYESTIDAPNVRATIFTGTGSGDSLTLSGDFVDTKTREQRKATVTMTLSDSVYRVTTDNSGENDSYVASDIIFKKK